MRIFTFLLFISIIFNVSSQNYFFKRDISIPVKIEGKDIVNAWTGGINTAQISKADFNNDGVEDLFVYDKTSNKISTYVAASLNDSYFFKYAPKYESLFPPVNSWVLAVDYNGDGKKDLFMGASGGDVAVYKNESPATGDIKFKLAENQIITEGFSGLLPLHISLTDIPSLTDVDNDGDIDVLMFDATGGDFVHYHKNLSIEKYGHRDSLEFKRQGNCWGNFSKGHFCNAMEFGIDCGITEGMRKGMRVAHTGSTILALDLDNDGDKDLLTGNVECSNINQLINVGSSSLANFTSSTIDFPNSNDKPELKSFLAAFYEDVDFDGKSDLLISPNLSMNEGNLSSFDQSLWYYKNNGNSLPEFDLVNKNFLQNETIDVGEYSYPALADLEGDGDLDLFVGNRGKIQSDGSFYATIFLFENKGSVSSPSFELVNSDYLGFSSLKYHSLKPAFADINKDGKKDLIFTSTIPSTLKASMGYILNTATTGLNVNLSSAMDINFTVNDYDSPYLIDVDEDGVLDLMLGRSQGRLEYYRNSGSNTTPSFSLVTNKAGGIDNNILVKNVFPVVANLDKDGTDELILADRNGDLRIVSEWKNELTGNFTFDREFLFDEITESYKAPIVGREVFPAVGDLNNDGFPEMILGTNAGGLIYLKNEKAVTGEEDDYLKTNFKVYPNPSQQKVFVESPRNGLMELHSISGQKLFSKTIKGGDKNEINIASLTKGLYLVRFLDTHQNMIVKKLIIE